MGREEKTVSFLDYKDAKNIIIWFLTGSIGLSVYAYKSDQKLLKKDNESTREVISQKLVTLGESVSNEVGSLDTEIKSTFRELRSLCIDLKDEQKIIKNEQRLLKIDLEVLKSKGGFKWE